MTDAASPEVIGRYAIYGKIASGGMASVHFGRLLGGAGFSRTVAIKRLHPHLAEDPEFLSTMIDEARLAARIHHPNVVPTLDVVAADGELLLVMEYVRGESLARLVRIEGMRGRLVPPSITSAVVIGALHGLHAAHEATDDHGAALGMVHRDVSPQNILVGVDGMSRVIDFGVAKAAGRLQTTREGTIKGKIAYMAPEQLSGHHVTRAADVYAMGAVLWEALTGKRLFQADSDAALVTRVLAGANEPPSAYAHGVPPHLDAIVMRALSRDPAARFRTARDMAELLTRSVPPSLPTDVGEWCNAAAHDSLAKRGMLLAEIESSSGSIIPGPSRSSSHDLGKAAGTGSGWRAQAPAGQPMNRTLPMGAAFVPAPPPDDVPNVASQSASISMTASTRAGSGRWKALGVFAGLGATLAIGIAVGLWGARRPQAPMTTASPVPATSSAAAAADSAPGVAAAPSASASSPVAVAPAPPPTSPSAPPSTPEPAEPPAPAPTHTSTPVARATHASTTPAAAPAAASAKSANCSPSYFFDPNGDKHFKPECFGH